MPLHCSRANRNPPAEMSFMEKFCFVNTRENTTELLKNLIRYFAKSLNFQKGFEFEASQWQV